MAASVLVTSIVLTGCAALGGAAQPPNAGDGAAGAASTPTPSPTPKVMPPVTLEQLLTAPVPALCEHAPGTLVDGTLPGLDRAEGIVTLQARTAMDDGSGRDPLSLIAVNPAPKEGELAALAVFQCDRGGVEWPAQLVGYDAELNVLGALNPSDLTRGPKDYVWNLSWDDSGTDSLQRVTFDWASHYAPEPSARGSLRTVGTVTFASETGELELLTPDILQATDVAGEFFTAIQAKDWPTVEALTTDPEVPAYIESTDHPQRVLTLDWSPEKRAICVPPEHEVLSDYGAQLMREAGGEFFCMPSSTKPGEVIWLPGVYVKQDSASGDWVVSGLQLYAD